ncbi:hypothetical protein EBZ38_08290 [bacterium]|nr:hypothetical protein [Betaproteobacteria bacterium]NDC95340.1 hypothetical protein [bacterium]NDD84254.1 hypothetical protein [bacterium]NDG19517.1 hypothetical protein [Betaproteobacteria bacterium]
MSGKILLPNDFFNPKEEGAGAGAGAAAARSKPLSKRKQAELQQEEEAHRLMSLCENPKLKKKEVEEYFRSLQ